MGCLFGVLRELKNKILHSAHANTGPKLGLRRGSNLMVVVLIHLQFISSHCLENDFLYHVGANWCFDLDSLNYI